MSSNNNTAAVAKLNDHLTIDGGSTTTIITLAGENSGATMETATGDAEDLVVMVGNDNKDEEEVEEEEGVVVSAYTNSNYQTVNNSVLVAGSFAVNDPGVHVVVVDHVDEIRDIDDDHEDDFDDGQDEFSK